MNPEGGVSFKMTGHRRIAAAFAAFLMDRKGAIIPVGDPLRRLGNSEPKRRGGLVHDRRTAEC